MPTTQRTPGGSQRPRYPNAPRLNLVLTDDLIADARKRDSSHCMYAEAIKAAFPGARQVSVDIQTMRFTDPEKGLRYTYLTPRAVQVNILKFDQGIVPAEHTAQLRGASITLSRSRRKRAEPPRAMASPAQLAAVRKAEQMSHQGLGAAPQPDAAAPASPPAAPVTTGRERVSPPPPRRALHQRDNRQTRRASLIPDVVGGDPPPITPVGRRRAFGLRAMDR